MRVRLGCIAFPPLGPTGATIRGWLFQQWVAWSDPKAKWGGGLLGNEAEREEIKKKEGRCLSHKNTVQQITKIEDTVMYWSLSPSDRGGTS